MVANADFIVIVARIYSFPARRARQKRAAQSGENLLNPSRVAAVQERVSHTMPYSLERGPAPID
jgi:hypothetical protein